MAFPHIGPGPHLYLPQGRTPQNGCLPWRGRDGRVSGLSPRSPKFSAGRAIRLRGRNEQGVPKCAIKCAVALLRRHSKRPNEGRPGWARAGLKTSRTISLTLIPQLRDYAFGH